VPKWLPLDVPLFRVVGRVGLFVLAAADAHDPLHVVRRLTTAALRVEADQTVKDDPIAGYLRASVSAVATPWPNPISTK
jgi:hypothetical protein